MTIELLLPDFSGIKINLGGRPVLPGTPTAYISSRIAQNGVNHDSVFGTCSISGCLGDFSGNGSVGNDDLTLLFDNWGDVVPPVPAGWNGLQPSPPNIGNDELSCLLDHWGDIFGIQDGAAVPEPGAVSLLAAAVVCMLVGQRRVREIP
jgi:hypothetical protein